MIDLFYLFLIKSSQSQKKSFTNLYFMYRSVATKSNNERLTRIRTFVVFLICCLNVTTKRTRPLPMAPNTMTTAKTIGTMIEIMSKK